MSRYPEHLRGFRYIGFARYFLTFCTHERRRHFEDAANVTLANDQFLRAAREESFDVIAYCFMPDHLHLLAEATRKDSDLKRFIKAAKQLSGYYFKRARREALWQRYGYEHVLRDEESTPAIIKYIIENPIRAGLAVQPLDYPHWGSFVCSREELLEYIARAA